MEIQEFTPGTKLIEAERERQISEEGYSSAHDATHTGGEMCEAGACYADLASSQIRGATVEEIAPLILDGFDSMLTWPWDDEDFKPTGDPIRNLVIAGALIAAEIDRLQRLPNSKQDGG